MFKSKPAEIVEKHFHKKASKVGMSSFEFKMDKRSQQVIDRLVNECIFKMLDNGVNNFNGTNLSIEIPKYMNGWCEWDFNRKTPIRQHFGKTTTGKNVNFKRRTSRRRLVKKRGGVLNGSIVRRATYDVGSKEMSIGGDVKTTITRDWAGPIEEFAGRLSSAVNKMYENERGCRKGCHHFEKGLHYLCKNVQFNHCSILFYFADSDTTGVKEKGIGYHTDVNYLNSHKKKISSERTCKRKADALETSLSKSNGDSKSNGEKDKTGHVQVPFTPTIVLSLGDDKTLQFAKRTVSSEGKPGKEKVSILSKQLSHKSLHFLHPHDEMFMPRDGEGKDSSQFQHRVVVKCDHGQQMKACVSLCFRQVKDYKYYHKCTNTLVHPTRGRKCYYYVENDQKSEKMKKRNSLMEENRREIDDNAFRHEINEVIQKFNTHLKKINRKKK